MSVELNHTIVPVRDKHASAAVLAGILGITTSRPVARFAPVTLANGVTLDYMNHADNPPSHYAFLVGENTFDTEPEPMRRDTIMATRPKRPAGRRAQATVFRVVNVPMRALLSVPVPTPMSRRLMLVHHTGRKTGKHYRQPVSYVADGDTLLTPGGGRWTRNLRDGQPVRVRLRGRTITARPELIRDPDEVERLLNVMTASNPALNRFVRIPTTPDGRRDRDQLARAIRYGFRIVRWRLDNNDTTP